MSLINHIDQWIIKMFKFNEREEVGNNASYYLEGLKIENICTEDEIVYGQFSSKNTTYYFTNESLIIDNGKLERIKIKNITETNGSFRSSHKTIYIVAASRKINIKITDFPYRIQQLFYQLIENHGSLIKKPIFYGLTRLVDYSSDLIEEEQIKFKLQNDTHTLKSIKLDKVSCFGELKDGIIFPDGNGILVFKGLIGQKEIEIFNSQTDGYNGVLDYYENKTKNNLLKFKELKHEVTRIIINYIYTIQDYEFDELKTEIGLKSKNEINNLFSSIVIYTEKDGQLTLLTEYETQ
jgi:hypothetical protein